MKVEVRLIQEDDRKGLPDSQKYTLAVETHTRRNDSFNILKTDNVQEGHEDPVLFEVPPGGRLVLNVPKLEEVVYDREQGAAVPVAGQAQPDRADAPKSKEEIEAHERLKNDAERHRAEQEKQDRDAAAAKAAQTGQQTGTASTGTVNTQGSSAHGQVANVKTGMPGATPNPSAGQTPPGVQGSGKK